MKPRIPFFKRPPLIHRRRHATPTLQGSIPLPGLFRVPAPAQWLRYTNDDRYSYQGGPACVAPFRGQDLIAVNNRVNALGWTADDPGRDIWEPKDGDCEDLSLLKRQILVEEHGWDWGALRLMTVVQRRDDTGHAILCAVTDRGDYILDNLSPFIGPWRAFTRQYQFISRHVEGDVWESLAA